MAAGARKTTTKASKTKRKAATKTRKTAPRKASKATPATRKTARKLARKPAKATSHRALQSIVRPRTPRRAPQPAPGAPEELAVVVARSLVAQGRIDLREQAPDLIELPLGSLLLVRHAYQVQESSPDKETYTFRLHASLGEHGKEPVVETVKDRMGVEDDLSGFIQQRFRPREPGTYRLEFAADTEYTVQPWASKKVQQHDRRAAAGVVKVVVA